MKIIGWLLLIGTFGGIFYLTGIQVGFSKAVVTWLASIGIAGLIYLGIFLILRDD